MTFYDTQIKRPLQGVSRTGLVVQAIVTWDGTSWRDPQGFAIEPLVEPVPIDENDRRLVALKRKAENAS